MFPEATGSHYGRRITDECRAAGPLAGRLRDSRASLSLRWLERISARVGVSEREMFPTEDLLDHVPLLIEAIADYLDDPTEEGPSADRVLGKASELGQMRFRQGFSPYQILKEFEVLGGIVLSYLSRAADEVPVECPPGEFMLCTQRVHRALALIQQATAGRYLSMLETHASEREQRLRALNEILSGPLSQRLEDAIAAARLLEAADSPTDLGRVHRLRARLERVAEGIEQLRLLSRLYPSSRMQRNVPLNAATAEAVRTLREFAHERGIEVRVPEPLPELEVNAAAVELAVLVFLSTLIRHGEVKQPERWIEIRALAGDTESATVVQLGVRDVGAVIPEETRKALLEPVREEDASEDASPAGLSLQIAREAVDALGGRIALRATEDPPTTEFLLDLPSRRAEDAPAAE